MSLFRLDASIRLEGSASRELADLVEAEWVQAHGSEGVRRRHIGVDVLPADAWPSAVSAKFVPEDQHDDRQRAAAALADQLIDELLDADAVLLAVPLYNYGVSQHIKTYLDLIMTDPRATSAEPLLAGKPVVLITTRGGAYGPGTPRHGWDHSTGYLRRILADQWGADLTVIEREFTLVGVNPALDSFTDVAADLHIAARDAAVEAGRALAAAVPSRV
ncbi:MAG TPA: NAD(P)H-dependent oxidoreductase [Pseudonocardiaceae bacterium]|nr:NAD(P)H-dependent oxidoreductase [Pseudonocardiaceae bacterium]